MKNLTYIYLIRHSEQLRMENSLHDNSQIANEKIVLTVNGEKNAEQISKLEELKNIDELWSSSYVRAVSTAKYIAKENNLVINIDKNFNERKLRRFRKVKGVREPKK